MAKLAIILALFALLALRQVSAFRTTVTTTVVEDDGLNPQQQDCQQQIQKQGGLRSCQRYLSESQQQQSYFDLEMVVENPQQREQETLNDCCRELENVGQQCRCQAVSHAFKQHQQQQHGESARQQQQQVRQSAETLPSKCNLSPQRCQIGSIWA